jgi:hypothetical protein
LRRVKEPVPYEEAKRRALVYLRGRSGLVPASWVAEAIWPKTRWIRSQGAGGAALRILKRMEKEGLAEWWVGEKRSSWGWRITPKGKQSR